jgi:hypothetical protein
MSQPLRSWCPSQSQRAGANQMSVSYLFASKEFFKAVSAKVVEIIDERAAHEAYNACHSLPAEPSLPLIVDEGKYASFHLANHEYEKAKEENTTHDREHEIKIKTLHGELFKWLTAEHWYMVEVPRGMLPGNMTMAVGVRWDTWGGDHKELVLVFDVKPGDELPSLDRKIYN